MLQDEEEARSNKGLNKRPTESNKKKEQQNKHPGQGKHTKKRLGLQMP